MCTRGICCQVSINAFNQHLDQHLIDFLIETWLTLDQYSVDISIFHTCSTVGQ